MNAMNIDTIANFPFPTPPDRGSLLKSEKVGNSELLGIM
jgi:ATP-dependent RNA helicase DHX37/DHR1